MLQQQEMEILQGSVVAVIYQNYDNGYSVLRLRCDDAQTVTVVGTIPMPTVGEGLVVTGKWASHSTYGRQFEAEFLERTLPKTTAEILAYLSGRIIKGVGPMTAARIVEKFGERALDIMENEPQRLAEISGISATKAQAIGEEFRQRVGMRHLMEFMTAHQLPAELAVQVYKRYGENAVELLQDDPYMLMDLDAPFGAVDRFAIELGVDADDPRRVEAGILFELHYNMTAGHSFLPYDKLVIATASLLNVDPSVAQSSMERLLETERIVLDKLADMQIVYLPALYRAECYIARRLGEAAHLSFAKERNLERMLRLAQEEGGIAYSGQQTEAIRASLDSGLLLITGGPGTGKTTILQGILSVYRQMGLKCVLAAPTGRAAKRLIEVTQEDASTIHRLLEATIDTRSGEMYFVRDENNPLKADAVIVDEMSMVDVLLLESLLRAVPERARLIFVGDPDQLPPVGPGSPFSDCLRSERLPAVRLTEIFRQAQKSLIVMNAHRVNNGEMPELKDVKNDFFFMRCASEAAVGQIIEDLCSTRLPKNMGISPDQIQVLTPTKKGGVGTWSLNRRLQNSLNPLVPGKRERIFGDFSFREGDRVMQIRNNYDIMWKKRDGSAVGCGVFNGDVGIIASVDPQMQTLTVLFEDREVVYDFNQLSELEPAYAMTVHKSQGSEYRAVIFAAWSGHPNLMCRSVLYTAITRARELLIIVGREDVVAAMTENAKRGRRYTGLKLRLQGRDT